MSRRGLEGRTFVSDAQGSPEPRSPPRNSHVFACWAPGGPINNKRSHPIFCRPVNYISRGSICLRFHLTRFLAWNIIQSLLDLSVDATIHQRPSPQEMGNLRGRGLKKNTYFWCGNELWRRGKSINNAGRFWAAPAHRNGLVYKRHPLLIYVGSHV